MRHVALAAIVAMSLFGCQRKAEEPKVEAPTPTTLTEESRQNLAKVAFLAKVTHVQPDNRLARIVPDGADLKEFKPADTVLFVAGGGQTVAAAEVVEVKGEGVFVQYAPPGQNERAPVVGDTAIKFKPEQPQK
jgi:hypothetical protein